MDPGHEIGSLAQRRVLVTGAAGFIGSHLVHRLLADGAEVHAIVRPDSPALRLAAVRDRARLWAAEITDLARLREIVSHAAPEVVFHLAADTGVRRLENGWEGVARSLRSNVEGSLAVLRATLEATPRATRFVRAGGLEEYGRGPTPYAESQREQPISPYSASQVAATHYCEMLQHGTDVALVTLRPALVYGPGQSSDFLIPSLIASCLRGEDFELTAGTQSRDLLYVDDLIEAFVLAATRPGVRGGVINLGHGIEHAVRDVAAEIVRLAGGTGRLRIGARPARAGDLEHLVTTTTKAADVLGWSPRVPLTDGLARTIEWYRAHLLGGHVRSSSAPTSLPSAS
jgi:nucleoside-diphosphate-sugar epimerase